MNRKPNEMKRCCVFIKYKTILFTRPFLSSSPLRFISMFSTVKNLDFLPMFFLFLRTLLQILTVPHYTQSNGKRGIESNVPYRYLKHVCLHYIVLQWQRSLEGSKKPIVTDLSKHKLLCHLNLSYISRFLMYPLY